MFNGTEVWWSTFGPPRIAFQPAFRGLFSHRPLYASTVLVGDTGKLDSVAFVNLAISIEENIERDFHAAIPVLDTILNGDGEEWRGDDLPRRLAEQLPAARSKSV